MVREGVCGTCLPPAVIGPPVGSLPFLSTDAAINNIPVIRGLPAPAVVLKASHRLWAVHSGQCIRYFDVYDQSTRQKQLEREKTFVSQLLVSENFSSSWQGSGAVLTSGNVLWRLHTSLWTRMRVGLGRGNPDYSLSWWPTSRNQAHLPPQTASPDCEQGSKVWAYGASQIQTVIGRHS